MNHSVVAVPALRQNQLSKVERNRARDRLVTGREVCERCRRPIAACYCAHIRPIDTKTKLVILQHPRERYVAIGTAHMASLCLTHSELHVGLEWSKSEALLRVLSDPDRRPILLYPGKDAIDIVKDPPSGPVTLVVVDGTWAQTKKVVRENPILAKLPRYAFVPPSPSEYRIRKEPDDASVATIEALVHALAALEGTKLEELLTPFRAMVDYQIACEQRHRESGSSSRHTKYRSRPKRRRVPRVISDHLEDVVCVAGEANAWPYAVRQADPVNRADELVHWAAFRPSTGESFSMIVKPTRELAPGTAPHTGIPSDALMNGASLESLHTRWREFVRDTDVICAWGKYETGLFEKSGGYLPKSTLDLRNVARDITNGVVGTLSDYRDRVCANISEGEPITIEGRAGRKLRALRDIIQGFQRIRSDANDSSDTSDANNTNGANDANDAKDGEQTSALTASSL